MRKLTLVTTFAKTLNTELDMGTWDDCYVQSDSEGDGVVVIVMEMVMALSHLFEISTKNRFRIQTLFRFRLNCFEQQSHFTIFGSLHFLCFLLHLLSIWGDGNGFHMCVCVS